MNYWVIINVENTKEFTYAMFKTLGRFHFYNVLKIYRYIQRNKRSKNCNKLLKV